MPVLRHSPPREQRPVITRYRKQFFVTIYIYIYIYIHICIHNYIHIRISIYIQISICSPSRSGRGIQGGGAARGRDFSRGAGSCAAFIV